MRQLKRMFAFVCLLGLFLVHGAAVHAEIQMSDTYIKTVYIERVFTHRLGYKIQYNVSNFRIAEALIPHTWFTPAGQAEIVFANSRSVPYMEVVFRGGEFSHVRLFVHSSPGHPSWVSLQDSEEVTRRFQETTTFNVRF